MKLLLSIGFALLIVPFCQSQSSNSHWRFGNEIGVDFNSTPPTAEASNMVVGNSVEPAVISDFGGNLVAYCNGATIYNNEGNEVIDASFTTTSTENVLVPAVGSANLYYLFRSGPTVGSTYTIIDMAAADGQGQVVEGMKDIVMDDYISQIVISSHENEQDIWVMLINNNDGSGDIVITSYLLNEEGISLVETYSHYFIFADFFPALDDARISPNCQTIATSHKGHYVTLFELDRATGEIVNQFDNSLGLPDSFSDQLLNYIEFSPDGSYLYVLSDHSTVQRFSTASFDPDEFQDSGVTLFGVNTIPWRHIKRGPDQKMYIFNQNTGALDMLDNLDDPDPENVTLTTSYVTVGGKEAQAEFFPNTASLCTPEPGISVGDFCIPDNTVSLISFGFEFADSTYWNVEQEDGSFENFYGSNLDFVYTFEGEYDVSFNYLIAGNWVTIEESFIALFQPDPIDLGEPVIICDGEEVEFSIDPTLYDIQWSTDETTPSIVSSEAGDISVTVTNGFCSVSDETSLLVQLEPIASLEDIGVCETNLPLTLSAFSSSAENYDWNTGEDGTSIDVNTAGTYWVELSNDCFVVRDSLDVSIFTQPIVDLGPDQTICAGEIVAWDIGNEEYDIIWYDNSTSSTFETTSDGIVSVGVINVLCVATDEVDINVIFEPDAPLEDIVICDDPSPITLDATNPSTEDYLWNNGSTNSTLEVSQSGSYQVVMTNSCFVREESVTVTYVFLPTNLLPDTALVCGEELVSLTIAQEGLVTWSTGEFGPSILNGTDSQISVQLNMQGCLTDDEIEIVRLPYPDVDQLIYPNVITLNADELNKQWQPFELGKNDQNFCETGIIDLNIQIFDRWGGKLAVASCHWDGKRENNDKEVEKGTYYYIVDVTSSCLSKTKQDSKAGFFEVLE